MTGLIAMIGKLAPVAFIFTAGVVFARRKIIDAGTSKAFSEFAFRFAIPAYLLGSLYTADLRRVFNLPALAAYTVAAAIAACGVAAIAITCGHGPRIIALRIMAACQVNTAYVAIPVFALLFGDVSPIFPVILLQVCVLTTVVITIMESGSRDAGVSDIGSAQGGVLRAVWSALTTPVVLACWAGIAANTANVSVPQWVLDALAMAGAAASPVALFALGLHMGGAGLRWRGASRDEYWIIAFKCVGLPLLALAVAHFGFHVTGPWLAYIVMIAAMPSPQNLFIFAQTYDTDVDLAASVVVKTTITALILLPLWAVMMTRT